MTDPIDIFGKARARNRAMVVQQRKALGVDRQDEPTDTGKLKGVARMVVPMITDARTYHRDGDFKARVLKAIKDLRRDVQSVPGRNLDHDEQVVLANGDVECRAWWSQRMTRAEADEAMAKQAALRGESH